MDEHKEIKPADECKKIKPVDECKKIKPVDFYLIHKHVFQVLSGKEFKKIFSGIVFVKLTNEEEIHGKINYKTGFNEDVLEFNPTGECSSGGMYFTTLLDIYMFMNINGTEMVYYREVVLDDDSKVYVENCKFKTDKFHLSDRKKIDELWNSKQYCSVVVNEYPNISDFICDSCMSIELRLAVVKKNGLELKYIKEQTLELCSAAVKQNKWALKYVEPNILPNETYLKVVCENGLMLQCVNIASMTNEICLAAVNRDGWAFEYVPHKYMTSEICLVAANQDGLALKLIPLAYMTSEICTAAVQQNSEAIKHVPSSFKTEELCLIAVETFKNMLLSSVPFEGS